MPRKIIILTDEMDRVIQSEAERRGAPFASIVREAIVEWAARRNIVLEETITWGNPRQTEHKDERAEQGEKVAVAAG